MFFIILALVIPVAFFIWQIYQCFVDWNDYGVGIHIILAIFLPFIIFVLIGFLAMGVDSLGPHNITKTVETPIYSMSSNIGNPVRGTFFLGFGSANSKPCYFAYVQDANDVKHIINIEFKDLNIIEGDHVPAYKVVTGQNEPNFWFCGSIDKTLERTLYVPKDSIVKSYQLN